MRKRNFQRFVLSGFLFLSFYTYSDTGAVPVSPATQASIEQEQEQRQRLQDVENSKQSVQQLSELPTLPAPQASAQAQQCFPVRNITFTGNTLFPQEQLLALSHFKPGCQGLAEINEYLRLITNEYVAAGYVTSWAYLVPQDCRSGNGETCQG